MRVDSGGRCIRTVSVSTAPSPFRSSSCEGSTVPDGVRAESGSSGRDGEIFWSGMVTGVCFSERLLLLITSREVSASTYSTGRPIAMMPVRTTNRSQEEISLTGFLMKMEGWNKQERRKTSSFRRRDPG